MTTRSERKADRLRDYIEELVGQAVSERVVDLLNYGTDGSGAVIAAMLAKQRR